MMRRVGGALGKPVAPYRNFYLKLVNRTIINIFVTVEEIVIISECDVKEA